MTFSRYYATVAATIIQSLPLEAIELMAHELSNLKDRGGRLFILGVGGSAANASHAVNDFRKIAGIEAYAPTDNSAELTARTNDNGWDSVFVRWLETSHLNASDALLVLSVGGGSLDTSFCLVRAMSYAAKGVGAKVLSIVGPDGGAALRYSDVCVRIGATFNFGVGETTPHVEGIAGVITHLLVNHPQLHLEEDNGPPTDREQNETLTSMSKAF